MAGWNRADGLPNNWRRRGAFTTARGHKFCASTAFGQIVVQMPWRDVLRCEYVVLQDLSPGQIRNRIGVTVCRNVVPPDSIERSAGKDRRLVDQRSKE